MKGLLLAALVAVATLARSRRVTSRKIEGGWSPTGGDAEVEKPTEVDDWSDPSWEPFKIALGTLYALCLQRGFDSTVAYFQRSPIQFTGILSPVGPITEPAAVVVILMDFVIWLSLFFLYNARLYLRLPRAASRARVTAYASLTLSFGAFYFFASSLGPPSRVQVFAISLIILADIAFPLHLGLVTHIRARLWWLFRDVGHLGVAVSILLFVPEPMIRNPVTVYVLLGLLTVQLFVAPREYRYQLGATRHETGIAAVSRGKGKRQQ